ncbi:hypothetical protein FDZ71_12330 [bacterium]|nr:MAG: hypothetical protein FDZ71_12330 [bacterium]
MGWTAPNTHHVDNELAYIGWKSGKTFATENLLDIYYGQAKFAVSDGFLVGDGARDFNQRGCFWLAPHASFERAAVIKINASPVRGDLFYLATDWSQGVTKGFGANVEYSIDKYGTVGAMFMTLNESDIATREGMKVYEGRYMGNPLADSVENFYLNLEYAIERNNDAAGKLAADALAAEVGYTFAAAMSPTLSYRFANYSGDEAATGSKSEAFDPLFQKAFGRGWGTWLEGELMGEFFYSNSNKKSHMLGLKAKPTDSISAGLLAYSFYADQGNGMTDSHMADEVNLYCDWTVSDKLFVTGAIGRAFPAKGLKDGGYDKNFDVFEVAAIVYF